MVITLVLEVQVNQMLQVAGQAEQEILYGTQLLRQLLGTVNDSDAEGEA